MEVESEPNANRSMQSNIPSEQQTPSVQIQSQPNAIQPTQVPTEQQSPSVEAQPQSNPNEPIQSNVPSDQESSGSDYWPHSYFSRTFKLNMLGITESEWDEFKNVIGCDLPQDCYKTDWFLENLFLDHYDEENDLMSPNSPFANMHAFAKINKLKNDFHRGWEIIGDVCDMSNGRNIEGRQACNYHIDQGQCTKCECHLTNDQKKQYTNYISKAKDFMKQKLWSAAFDMTMDALDICNQEQTIHEQCMLQIGMNDIV